MLRLLITSSGRPTPVAAAAAAALALLGAAAPAYAIEIDTGNADLSLRWDNTLRYNLGVRTQAQDAAMLANPNYDDGDRDFSKGKLVANRLDLLSEADIVWQKKIGARVSAAAWVDGAYSNLSNTNNATANTVVNGVPAAGVMSPYAKRYAQGPSGEFLDAFVFANVDLGGTPLSVRAGKHTVFWGESLLGGGAIQGISYGQYSLDLWKALSTPGIEAKELFRPRNSLTMQAQPTPELSLSAQTFFDWESVRYPESGSYLTVNDALLHGGDTLVAGPNQRLLQGAAGEPKKTGDFGLSARWSPDWLDGTAGLYLRRTADIQPQLSVTPAAAAVPLAACRPPGPVTSGGAYLGAPQSNGTISCYINPSAASLAQLMHGVVGQYNAYYGRDIDIYGLSLSKDIVGVSVGAELSYRKNMPLQSIPVSVLPAPLAAATPGALSPAQLAALNGDAPGARGNTLHGVLSLIGIVSKTALFDTVNWQAETVWNRWLSVTQNAAAFKGSDAYRSNPANVDAVTKDYVGLGVNITPTWFQVLPSVDLSMPLSWSGGIVGNSAVLSGGNKGAGSYSAGLSADIQQKYNVALRYVGFYGGYSTTASGAMNVPNGTNAVLSDRGHVLLTFKTTF
ncbi:MAG: DUF1302 domain-containing protein [Paucibacter sp.]|nr:DUF1302 domain-containing protein [Roseateles sp.]